MHRIFFDASVSNGEIVTRELDDLRFAISELTPFQRLVVDGRLDGFSNKEIADMHFGSDNGKVATHMNAAMNRMREIVAVDIPAVCSV